MDTREWGALMLIAHPVPFPALTPGHTVSPSLVFEPTKPETLGTGPGTCTVSTSQMTSCHTSRPPPPPPNRGFWPGAKGRAPSPLRVAGGERQRRGWGLPGTAVGPARGLLVTVPTAQAVAPEMGLATVAGAHPAVTGGSAVTATGGRLGPFPGTGRLPHPQQALSNRATPAHSRAAPSLAAVPRDSPFQGGVNSEKTTWIP